MKLVQGTILGAGLSRFRTPTGCNMNRSVQHPRSLSLFSPVPRHQPSKGNGKGDLYPRKSSGKNTLGNHYCALDPGPSARNRNVFHYSNRDGSFFYSNADKSKFFRSPTGHQQLITSAGEVWVCKPGGAWTLLP